ncbi:MAG: thioredoxin family protein [Lachnoclostridium sp.]|nr:thioredoxin family protein [Lachnoclostridium sp.]
MTYDQAISEKSVMLVEFFATWCPHCQRMMPVVAEVKELLDGNAGVLQLDIDQNQEAADAENVNSVPTFIIYKDGEEQWRHTGEIDGNALFNKVNSYV